LVLVVAVVAVLARAVVLEVQVDLVLFMLIGRKV
jgi:hypothetical protein